MESAAALTENNRKLRILRVASDTYPEIVGGFGLHVHHMSQLQAIDGHDVTVLTSANGNEELPRKEKRDGYEIIRHRELADPLNNSIIPGIGKSIWNMADEYDVLHAHSHLFFSTNLAAAMANFVDMPLVITNHGLISQTAPEWLQKLYLPTVAKYTLNAADRVLCYTETEKDALKQRGIEAPVSVIHNGIDTNLFRPIPRVDEKNQILFVGRLTKDKGVHTLLKAFRRVLQTHKEVTLKMVGDGPLRESLERKSVSYGIDDSVEFAGNLPNETLPEVYNESRIFVLPSFNEGLPRTVLESMACKTPPVTSALPQLEPLLDGTGITVTPGSDFELAQALEEILSSDDRRRRMAERGRKRVVEEYSWANTVSETTEEYYNIINQTAES